MISDASPVGMSRSAKKSTAFAPGQQAADRARTSRARAAPIRSEPPRRSTIAAMIPPAAMKRVETASSGGIVSPAIAMKRYVEPQMM